MASGIFHPAVWNDDGHWGTLYVNANYALKISSEYGGTSVFVRFPNITIPQGSIITEAFIRFFAYDSDSDAVSSKIYFNASDSAIAPTTCTEGDNLSLTNYASWSIPAWTRRYRYDTPPIASILQDVINRDGWSSGNAAMVVIKYVSGDRREACAVENVAKRARLYVEWTSEVLGDYVESIDINNYLYKRKITVIEKDGRDWFDLSVKLSLNSTNFNFALAKSNGSDFRVGEYSNGSGILYMWVASWDQIKENATIWFKLPLLLANEVKTLYVYWGNSTDVGISDINSVGFLISDGFDGNELDIGKWDEPGSGSVTIRDSKIRIGVYIELRKKPFSNVANWVVEFGAVHVGYTPLEHCHRQAYKIGFLGTENLFEFRLYCEGWPGWNRRHNIIDSGQHILPYKGFQKGIEHDSWFNLIIAYYEPVDRVYQGLSNRDSFQDYIDSWERQVEGDTRITTFRFYGYDSSIGAEIWTDWIIAREYFGDKDPIIDVSDLYIEYETVYPQPFDYTDYGLDVTDVDYYHESSFGGDPYKLSNTLIDLITNCWYSDENGASEDSVDLIIDFGRLKKNLVARKYIHYDSGHVCYLNASKLSDKDIDVNLNNYFQSTTISGYVAINFGDDAANINCLTVKAVESNLDGMIKNFVFECSDVDPRFSSEDQWKILYIGQFGKVSGWQNIYFVNDRNYRYYKLRFIDTYGENAALQEWGMFKYDVLLKKRVISQLRLYPACFSSQEAYFPKKINLYGSNNMVSWDILTSSDVKTYTPFSGYTNWWQRYSFDNTKAYWCYKLTCKGNWNNNVGKMAIAEWKMCEKHSESYIYRILQGATNNFSSIWALSNTAFDGGDFFIVNEGLNIISNDKLSKYMEIPGDVNDLNVL